MSEGQEQLNNRKHNDDFGVITSYVQAVNGEATGTNDDDVGLLARYDTIPGPVKFDKERDYHGRAMRQYPSWLPYLTALVTIGVGVFSSMSYKWQLQYEAPGCDGCPPEPFDGALLNTQLMFIGEALCYIVWYIDDAESRKTRRAPLFEFLTKESELYRKPTRWYFWPAAALHDFVATFLINEAYSLTYASTVEMLRNFMIVIGALMQMVIVRKALTVYEWVGVTFITVAMILAAIPAFLEPEDGDFSGKQISLGVVLSLVGTAVQSSQLLFEEWILRRGRYAPLKAVGVEGLAGNIYCFIAWGPFQKLIEDVNKSWYQQFHSKMILIITVLYVPGSTLFNAAGLGTTKLGGGLLRGICFACRAPLVWLISLAVKWQDYSNYNLASAIVFVIAFLMYINELPGLKKFSWYTKPIHCFCTKPELDGVAPGHEKEKQNLTTAHPEKQENEHERDYNEV